MEPRAGSLVRCPLTTDPLLPLDRSAATRLDGRRASPGRVLANVSLLTSSFPTPQSTAEGADPHGYGLSAQRALVGRPRPHRTRPGAGDPPGRAARAVIGAGGRHPLRGRGLGHDRGVAGHTRGVVDRGAAGRDLQRPAAGRVRGRRRGHDPRPARLHPDAAPAPAGARPARRAQRPAPGDADEGAAAPGRPATPAAAGRRLGLLGGAGDRRRARRHDHRRVDDGGRVSRGARDLRGLRPGDRVVPVARRPRRRPADRVARLRLGLPRRRGAGARRLPRRAGRREPPRAACRGAPAGRVARRVRARAARKDRERARSSSSQRRRVANGCRRSSATPRTAS